MIMLRLKMFISFSLSRFFRSVPLFRSSRPFPFGILLLLIVDTTLWYVRLPLYFVTRVRVGRFTGVSALFGHHRLVQGAFDGARPRGIERLICSKLLLLFPHSSGLPLLISTLSDYACNVRTCRVRSAGRRLDTHKYDAGEHGPRSRGGTQEVLAPTRTAMPRDHASGREHNHFSRERTAIGGFCR